MVLRIAGSAFHFAGTSIHLVYPVNESDMQIEKMKVFPLKNIITFNSLYAMAMMVNNGVELLMRG